MWNKIKAFFKSLFAPEVNYGKTLEEVAPIIKDAAPKKKKSKKKRKK